MVEEVKITVVPSISETDLLDVRDAMQQVLDFFTLLSDADKSIRDNSEQIIWRLSNATMNSPLTVTANAYSKDPSVHVTHQAIRAKRQITKVFQDLTTGKPIPDWVNKQEEVLLRNILKRNLNGIGRTDIMLGDNVEPIVISHQVATQCINNLDLAAIQKLSQKEDFTHNALGSIEGEIIRADTFYSQPSLLIRERLSNKDVRCTLKNSIAAKIGVQHNLYEIWNNKRILVEGLLSYDMDGVIVRIEATDITLVESTNISVDKIFDPNFTGGLAPIEYLNQIRGDSIE